ncbi:MAG TPA: Xaa-Pro peptidase family protein [Bryobacteraceae bacterium]|nr:Xaa-Pro peptidase family protein [Bryobacteraceae bacterium]
MTEIDQRRHALSARLAGLKVDGFLISSPANLRYLTGYAGSNGLLLLTAGDAHFFTDPRYAITAAQEISCKVHVETKALLVGAATLIKRKRLKKIGFESSWLRYEEYGKLKDELGLGAGLHPIGKVIEEQRMVKSAAELDLIRRSVITNSQAFAKTIRRVKPGVREVEIAAELDYQMRALGAEKAAFETIVAAGERSALPHAQPTTHRLGENELLLIDMGASQDGYASDMTRVAHAGTPPKRILKMYRAVLEAQLAAINAVRAGVTTGSVDAAARNVLKLYGLDRAFVHSTGHGLGLEIHEPPRIARKDKTELQAGMAITIEPGAYIEGLGGIRIEDTVLVTERGCEILTPTPKELLVI